MYALKPLITNDLTSANDCMYAMKNIHRACSRDEHASKCSNNVTDITEKSPLPEVAILEARQEKILAELAQFKKQLLSFCDLLESKNDSNDNIVKISESREPIVVDLIVRADPRKPCWTIRGLKDVWRDVDFSIKSYTHSSVKESIQGFSTNSPKKFHRAVNVELIWMNVQDTEIIVSGISGYPLRGETNFLRYLARRLSNEISYVKSSNDERDISEMENLLDISHRLAYQESTKNFQSLLSEISKKLNKKNWLSGNDKPGIEDLAVWSAMKQATMAKIPNNLNSWYERCENTFLK